MAFEHINNQENPENREKLLEWIGLREKQAETENTSTANIQCAIDIAKLCIELGLFQQAWDGLESTRDTANSENDGGELVGEIDRLMDEIESRI